MYAGSRDNVPTIAAIGLVAYVTTDIAHHALGHGAACLIEGGRIKLLSSVFVDCSLTGSSIDLAGPLVNLALGLGAALVAHVADRLSTAQRLFCILLAAFNLMWFALQLTWSALSKTDDWAWAMHQWQVANLVRYGMIAAGVTLYFFIVRFIGILLAPFSHPFSRARIIVRIAWITAGAIACATAAFDHHPVQAIVRHALPQSLVVSIGILIAPNRAAPSGSGEQTALGLSRLWIAAAVIVAAVSILCLGPGITILG